MSREKPDTNLAKVRGLYTIFDAEEAEWHARKQQLNNLSSLSLFSYQESEFTDVNPDRSTYDAERPVTPIHESIKAAPKTYAGLSKLIYRRISPRPEWNHISEKDQSSLGAVIMGEVNAVWPLLHRQLADPFLTHLQNRELQRRITVHCVTVCEQLFLHYAEKVKILNSRGIFSGPANMSRIRGQLALAAGKYLNILSVRRHIISDLKKPPAKEQITFNREEASGSPTSPICAQTSSHLSFRKLIKSSRPKQKLRYQFNLNAEIQSIQSLMPILSLPKMDQLEPLTDCSDAIFQEQEEEEYEDVLQESEEDESVGDKNEDSFYVSTVPSDRPMIPRCPSEPIMSHTLLLEESLLREKEDDEDFLVMRSPSQPPASRQRYQSVKTPRSRPGSLKKSHSSLGLPTVPILRSSLSEPRDPSEDLKLLIAKQEKDRLIEQEDQDEIDDASHDMPPLIQFLSREAKNRRNKFLSWSLYSLQLRTKNRPMMDTTLADIFKREAQNENFQKLIQKEKVLDANYEEEMRERTQPMPEPQFPQPPVIQNRIPGASNPLNKRPITIRISDVKINDHVDLLTVTLQAYLPVYNDLTGDISQATVKELDANLFQGGELREVYSEIMKAVPNIHQRYDNDPLIVDPGMNVDLSKILASSTLVRPRSQQVINPKLRRDGLDMPWERQEIMWLKDSQRRQSGYLASDPSSVSQAQGEGYMSFHRFTPSQLNHPHADQGPRAYASWLQWWKNTINSDDFFNYLSTQDTDFLSVLFHFYDSDAAESETESMKTVKMEAQREYERKMSELKKEKEEFVPGLWNVKSVMLGGLGKDPDIIAVEDEFSEFATPRSTDRSQSLPQGGSRSLGGTPSMFQSPEKGHEKKHLLVASQQKNETAKLPKQNFPQNFEKDYPLRVAAQPRGPFGSTSSYYEETESTESASITLPVGTYGFTSSGYSSLPKSSFQVASSDQSSSVMTSSQDNSDEPFDQLQDPLDTSSDGGIYPMKQMSNRMNASKKQQNTVEGVKKSPLRAHSLKLHDQLTSRTFIERNAFSQNDTSTSSVVDSLPDTCSGKVKQISSRRSDEITKADEDSGLEKSSTELFSGSTAGDESTSGCVSLRNTLKRARGSSFVEELIGNYGNICHQSEEAKIYRSPKEETSRYERRKTVFRVTQPTGIDSRARIAQIVTEKNSQASSTQLRTASYAKTSTNASSAGTSKQDLPPEATLQERLEVVWYKLRMPDSQKLDSALKYSTDKNMKRLPDIVSSWEHVTDLIISREKSMEILESFEREASDPNRFFERGHRGSAVARLCEAKTRASLYKKLENIETSIKAALISIKTKFSGNVTYNGRPYMEKMEWDKIEMLYYLQQERRCIMLKEHGHSQPLDLFLSHGQMRLPAIMPPTGRRLTQLPLNSVKIAVPE